MEPQKITAWSYSRYGLYEQCPFKAKLLYIDKFKEPGSPALDKGVAVHSEIERYLKLKDEPLPQSAIKLCADYEELKAKKPYVELEVAFNEKWEPVDWFAKDAWARIKIDALIKDGDYCLVIDHKTGRVRDSYEPQLELYALTGLLMFPTVNTVDTALYFVDAGRKYEGQRYTRDDLELLKTRWTERVRPMLTDTTFPATPNQYCKSCVFRKSNGGVCENA
jgi:RecB family exonuclease